MGCVLSCSKLSCKAPEEATEVDSQPHAHHVPVVLLHQLACGLGLFGEDVQAREFPNLVPIYKETACVMTNNSEKTTVCWDANKTTTPRRTR